MLDGSAVTIKAAVLRYSVVGFLGALSSLTLLIAALKVTDTAYLSASFVERTKLLTETVSPWNGVCTALEQMWFWGELLTMLFNRKRRAVHDFMAGTVVVRDN